MKILAIGLDKNIANPGSPEALRQEEYSLFFEETHILILGSGQDKKICDRLWVYFPEGANKALKFFSALKKGNLIIKNRGIGVITSQDPFFAGLIAWRLAKKNRIKFHLQIHTDFLSPYFYKESFLNKFRAVLAKFLLSRADGIRVVSKRIADSIRSSGINLDVEPVVLPVFVDVEKITSSPVRVDLKRKYPRFDFIILMASRLTREKNIGLAVKSMPRILKIHPKTGLVIAGEGPEKNKIAVQIKEMGLDKNVILEPWADDLASYYKTADLFALTSNYEGYGRTILEAGAAGCHIVSSDVGTSREMLDEESIFKTGDGEDFVKKILRAIDGNAVSAKSLLFVPKDDYLKKYKKILEDIL